MVIDLTNTGQNHKLDLRCNGIILQQLDCFKYLGIGIDNQLKWERHIAEVTKRISFNNARLRMLRNILPRDVLIKIFNATSIPIIDYASSVWGGFSTTLGNIIKRLENAAARAITGNYDFDMKLTCQITPILLSSQRVCAVKILINGRNVMLFNVYMPCDTYYDESNLNDFNAVLDIISNTCTQYDSHQLIIGGDFNTDFSRQSSLHTGALKIFLDQECMKPGIQHVLCDVEYTYMSKISGSRSTIDHFLVTHNLFNTICLYESIHDGDNLSDHGVVRLALQLSVEYCTDLPVTTGNPVIQWSKANTSELTKYRCCLDSQLEGLDIPQVVLRCNEYSCSSHKVDIERLHNGIVNACLEAGLMTLPQRNDQPHTPPIHGWNEHVAERRESAMVWHFMWQQNGSPREGVIADIRKRTRAAYHYAIRYAKKQSDIGRANILADDLLNRRSRDFWTEVKRMKGTHRQIPVNVDGILSETGISELFANKYRRLYNSVSYSQNEMDDILKDIDIKYCSNNKCDGVCSANCICRHALTVGNIEYAIRSIKHGKSDGNQGLTTDHLKHGSHKLRVYISLLFTAMLSHGYIPKAMLLSTIVAIPKDRRKSLNESENYRGISLSSVQGKVLDWVILRACKDVLRTTDYQFGFKPEHSTTQCTFVVNETIQYYLNGGSYVYTMLLDASQAFDRVNYIQLFKILLNRGICPLVCRLLAVLYTRQSTRVKWGNVLSE